MYAAAIKIPWCARSLARALYFGNYSGKDDVYLSKRGLRKTSVWQHWRKISVDGLMGKRGGTQSIEDWETSSES